MKLGVQRCAELVWTLAITQLKAKYRSSFLGFLWTLLYPLGMMVIFVIVFSVFLRWKIENYPVYLLVGLILWRFFQNGTTAAMYSIVSRADLVKAMYFPRAVLATASVLSAFLDALLEMAALAILFLLLAIPGARESMAGMVNSMGFSVAATDVPAMEPRPEWILFPTVLLAELMIVEGLGLALSAIYVYFRDIREIWGLFTQALFFLTPVFYPPELVPLELLEVYNLNPLTRVLVIARASVVSGAMPGLGYHLVLYAMALLILSIGLVIYGLLSRNIGRAM